MQGIEVEIDTDTKQHKDIRISTDDTVTEISNHCD